MPWSTSTRIEAQPTLSCKCLPTRQQHREKLQVHLSTYEKKTSISRRARISTLGNSSFLNQYIINPEMEISSKQSTKSYGMCLTSITLLLLAPRPSSGGRPSPLPVQEIRSDAWSRDHPHRSLSLLFELASVLSGSLRCAPGSVKKLCRRGSTDVFADERKNN